RRWQTARRRRWRLLTLDRPSVAAPGNPRSFESPSKTSIPYRSTWQPEYLHPQLKKTSLTFPTKVPSDSLGWIGSLKRTSDKSLFPMALGSCGHRITHQLRPINMNGRSILAVTSTLTFPTKVPSDSLGWIGSLKRTSDKSLFPMALGSCGHRITHQLRPINMNGRSILAVTSTLAFYASGRFLLHSGQFRSGLASRARAGRSIAMFAWQDRRVFRSDNPGCRR